MTKSIITSLIFWNEREGEKLCSYEVAYCSISVVTGINKFYLFVSNSITNCPCALMAIMVVGMINIHTN